MILAEVRDYVRQRGQATLSDIALHFDSNPDTVRGMLDIWISKGRIHKQPATTSCGSSCNTCESASTEIYIWSSKQAVPAAFIPGHCRHS